MNFDERPRRSGVKVLAIVLGSLGLLVVALLIGGYYVLMHTAVPLRMFASVFSSGTGAGDVRIEGISGSIAKGFEIKTIRWGKEGTDASEIQDVRVAYSSFGDLMGGQRVVFKEIHIGKAHLDVTGMEKLMENLSDDSQPYSGTNWSGGSNAVVWTNFGAGSRSRTAMTRRGAGLFQIDRLSVEDVFLTNRANGFSLSVPAFEWKGFKMLSKKVELGDLKIDSDRLKVTTSSGEEVEINGKKVAFQKKLEGTILPRLHPAVRQPIAFTIDVGHNGRSLFWRIKALDGKFEACRLEDRSGFVRCEDLDLAAYMDAPVPQHLSMEALLTSDGTAHKDGLRLSKGSFQLGVKKFEIQPLELESSERETETNDLVAVSRSGDSVFTYHLIVPDQPWKIEQRLTATPPVTPEETLARVFYDKRFEELSEDKQEAVKKMKASFGGWTRDETEKVAPLK